MFERSNLEVLAAFKSDRPVVSLYLNMDPRLRGAGTVDAYKARLKGLLKEISGRAPSEELAAIEAYFEKEFDWTGRSVVVFSSQDSSLWQVEQFAVPIRSRVHVGPKPFIMPLANVFDAYGAYAVALVDQQAIRMFYFHLGEVIATENREGEEIKRIKVSGGAAGRMRGGELSSHLGETVNRNLRQFAERLAAFCAYHKAEHILLGGAEPTLHQFKDMLSQPWRDRVEGMFSISVRASEAEVLEESLMAMRANLHTREARLVDTITTLAAKGANGVVGKEGTIAAVDAGRVQTLVLVEDVLPPEEADAAITRVVDYGGRVVFVDPDSPLVGTGGIGALLRY